MRPEAGEDLTAAEINSISLAVEKYMALYEITIDEDGIIDLILKEDD